MIQPSDRVRQHLHNVQVIRDVEKHKAPPYDWIITITFYAALHLVEKKIKEYGKREFQSHVDRNNHIATDPKFDKIALYYDTLYRESRVARYNCTPMTQGKAALAKKCLSEIEKFCK